MPETRNRPLLIGKIRLWWYAVAILPILMLVYLGLARIVSPLVALVGLFAFFFWLFSFGAALWTTLIKRKDTSE